MLAANQMNEQPLENTFVPQDQDLVHWSSYLKKRLWSVHYRETPLSEVNPCMRKRWLVMLHSHEFGEVQRNIEYLSDDIQNKVIIL